MKYGYMRVSTLDKQEFTRQEFLLKDYNLDRIFEEKISGTKKACGREEFGKLVECLKKGDEIYFESMSRMARSMQDLIETTNFLANNKKVKVIFLKENIVVGGNGMDAMSQLVFNIMGAFAQFERDLISDRTKQSLQAKKAQGVKLGRERVHSEELRAEVAKLYARGRSMREIADMKGISTASVHRFVKESK